MKVLKEKRVQKLVVFAMVIVVAMMLLAPRFAVNASENPTIPIEDTSYWYDLPFGEETQYELVSGHQVFNDEDKYYEFFKPTINAGKGHYHYGSMYGPEITGNLIYMEIYKSTNTKSGIITASMPSVMEHPLDNITLIITESQTYSSTSYSSITETRTQEVGLNTSITGSASVQAGVVVKVKAEVSATVSSSCSASETITQKESNSETVTTSFINGHTYQYYRPVDKPVAKYQVQVRGYARNYKVRYKIVGAVGHYDSYIGKFVSCNTLSVSYSDSFTFNVLEDLPGINDDPYPVLKLVSYDIS